MAKKKSNAKASPSVPATIPVPAVEVEKLTNELRQLKLLNGLAEVLGFNLGDSPMITQVLTIFRNLRNYLISNMRQPLSEAYVEIGIVKNVVDIPVDDALRGGFVIKSKQLSEEELHELNFTLEQENDVGILGEALKWNRLYGGAGVLIINGDDWSQELDIERDIKEGEELRFKAVDMWELFWDQMNTSAEGGDGEPMDSPKIDYYRYYGKNVHKSRVLILKGVKAPSLIRPRLRGWGLSIIEGLVHSINKYLKANDVTFEVLDEFKVDIYKIKNLTSTLMSDTGQQKVAQRIALANQQKAYNCAITMDKEDDFEQKELQFTGLADTMIGIRMHIAADMRMPMTKLFGISATGFNSGEDDIEVYNGMVEGTVRDPARHHAIKMVKIRCMQLFGYIPDDLTVDFKPLRVLSSEQEENVKTNQFNRAIAAATAGYISQESFKEMANQGKWFPIAIDPKEDTLAEKMEADMEMAQAGKPEGKPGESKGGKGKESSLKSPEAKS